MLALLAAYLVFGEFDESDPAQNGNGADSSTASQTQTKTMVCQKMAQHSFRRKIQMRRSWRSGIITASSMKTDR